MEENGECTLLVRNEKRKTAAPFSFSAQCHLYNRAVSLLFFKSLVYESDTVSAYIVGMAKLQRFDHLVRYLLQLRLLQPASRCRHSREGKFFFTD
jgi:hypothetical protein